MLNNVCYICGAQDYYYYTSTGNTYTSASISEWNLKRLIMVGDIYVGFGYNLDTTTSEIDVKMGDLVKRNGTVSFTRPQIGVYPTADSHLSTKQYVDEVMQNHLVDIDPHGFITTLN